MPDVLAIPFYFVADPERCEVTRKVFGHYAKVAADLSLEVVGVGSEGARSRRLWGEFFPDANYREYRQRWQGSASAVGSRLLRLKFDATVRATRQFDPQRVFIIGSDDILTAGFFAEAVESHADLVGVAGGTRDAVRLVRRSTEQVFVWDGRYPWAPDVACCGGGFGFSRRLLEEWRFAPFSEPGCEVGIERRARTDGASILTLPPAARSFRFWAVKGESGVLNGWDDIGQLGLREAPLWTEFTDLWDAL